MKKKLMSCLIAFACIFVFSSLAIADSATIAVSGNDLLVTVAKNEVPNGVAPMIRGVFTGWTNRPMTDSGNAWVYTKTNGAVYAQAAEFCIDLGGEKYLPEKASDFDALFAAGKVIYKPVTKGHNYLLVQ